MAFTKPNVNNVWAATGSIIAPAGAKIDQGWIAEIPDFEFENWIQNRQDQFNAHVNQYGIPVWDSVTEYIANKSYVQGSDGIIYRALTTNTNLDPTANPTDWVRAFDPFDASYTKTEADDRFLNESNNLSDLTNTATARTNLNVYSKSEADSLFQNPTQLVGMVAPFAMNSAPSGWLKCNGQAVSRTTYSALFNAIGTLYGSGDGSTTFNLPDLRGEFVRGFDDGRGVDVGRTFGSAQSSANKAHTHTGSTNSAGSHTHSMGSAGNHRHSFTYARNDNDNSGGWSLGGDAAYNDTDYTNYAGSHTHTINSSGDHTHTITIDSSGESEARPRNIAMLYCIKH